MIVVRVNSLKEGIGSSESARYRVRVESFEGGMNYIQGDYRFEDYRINGNLISFYDQEFNHQEASLVVNFGVLRINEK